MLPKTRLGKRSPLGALVSFSCPTMAPGMMEAVQPSVIVANNSFNRSKVQHPGLKVYFQCVGGGDGPGVMDQPDLVQSEVSASSLSPSRSRRSVSSCIDVPRSQRRPAEVDMDEMMAAMVLSSLSCSPLLHSPGTSDPSVSAPPMDCGSSELSNSGSSGYWSVGHASGSPTPSPPIVDPDASPATPPDEGLDMELEHVLFDEPAPRKRRNSLKVAYRCLWPTCGKVLTTVVGIKRHIRTMHLCRGGEHERCSRSEEDFYYTEITQHHQSPPPQPLLSGHAPSPPTSPFSASSPPSPPPPSPPSPASPSCSTLSLSAPSSSCGRFYQVQSEHSYQAPPPSHVISTASSRWTPTPTTTTITCHSKQGLPFRVRSVSVGEQWLQHQNAPCRRIRGEAKKCRKVYGIEHRDQWCTACRWKKACQRFID